MATGTVWLILYYGWFASEIYIGVSTRTRRDSGKVRDRGTMRLLWIVIASSMTAGITLGIVFGPTMLAAAGSNAGSQLRLDSGLRLATLATLLAGMALRWSAVISLGKSFSSNVAIHATQTVRKTGLYRWMRHPSYSGLLLCFLATGLQTRNWIALLVIVLPSTAALLYRIHVEEIALREAFGQEYITYSHETKRLIPGIY